MTPEQRDAHSACLDLIHRFPVLIDSGRFGELPALFTADATFNRPSEPDRVLRGRSAIVEDFSHRAASVGAHMVANASVEVLAPDRAVGVSYIMVVSSSPGPVSAAGFPAFPAQFRIGRFEDEYSIEGGAWRIRSRAGHMLLVAG